MKQATIREALELLPEKYIIEAEGVRGRDRDSRVLRFIGGAVAAVMVAAAAIPITMNIIKTNTNPSYQITVPENYNIIAYDMTDAAPDDPYLSLHRDGYSTVHDLGTCREGYTNGSAPRTATVTVGGIEYTGKYKSSSHVTNRLDVTETHTYSLPNGGELEIDEDGNLIRLDIAGNKYDENIGHIDNSESAKEVASEFIDVDNYKMEYFTFEGRLYELYQFSQMIAGVKTTNEFDAVYLFDGKFMGVGIERTDFSVVDPDAVSLLAYSDEALSAVKGKLRDIYSLVEGLDGIDFDFVNAGRVAYRTPDFDIGVHFRFEVTLIDSGDNVIGTDTVEIFLTFGDETDETTDTDAIKDTDDDSITDTDPDNRITKDDAEQIEEGMTWREVKRVIGAPTVTYEYGSYIGAVYKYEGNAQTGVEILYGVDEDGIEYTVQGTEPWYGFSVTETNIDNVVSKSALYEFILQSTRYSGIGFESVVEILGKPRSIKDTEPINGIRHGDYDVEYLGEDGTVITVTYGHGDAMHLYKGCVQFYYESSVKFDSDRTGKPTDLNSVAPRTPVSDVIDTYGYPDSIDVMNNIIQYKTSDGIYKIDYTLISNNKGTYKSVTDGMPQRCITKADADKITVGMTEDEVRELIGGPWAWNSTGKWKRMTYYYPEAGSWFDILYREEDRTMIVEKAYSIWIGMTEEEVIAAVGEPYSRGDNSWLYAYGDLSDMFHMEEIYLFDSDHRLCGVSTLE